MPLKMHKPRKSPSNFAQLTELLGEPVGVQAEENEVGLLENCVLLDPYPDVEDKSLKTDSLDSYKLAVLSLLRSHLFSEKPFTRGFGVADRRT